MTPLDGNSSQAGRHVRARMTGHSGRFRIERADGRVVRTIHGARHAQEAMALYFRGLGAALPGGMMSDLDRRLRRVRQPGNLAMQTPELPFEDAVPADPGGLRISRRGRPPRNPAEVPQIELFPVAAPEEAAPEPGTPAPVTPASVTPAPVGPAPAASAAPAARPEPQRQPTPPEPEAGPRLLDPQAAMLQRVDPRNLRPTDRADSYLYHVTNGSDAAVLLRDGLEVSAADPVSLTERQGVAYWLSMLSEDYDYIIDGPSDFVVLRLRRSIVEAMIEPDPDASFSAGCPCYLLTGAAA